MKRIRATAEIQALKIIIRERTDEVVYLRNENKELRKQLEESRAKEGKGILESAIDGMCKAFNSIDFSSMLSQKTIEEYSTNIESRHCIKYDADCVEDCDFDCEHCERAKLDEEDDT